MREVNERVVAQFRAGGPVEGMHRDRLLLLTTTGARTGRPRTTPMMFHREDDRLFVIASNSGAPRHPAWYGNLVADPDVVVEVGEETYQARATPLEGGEHARVWAAITAAYPFFREHAERAGRTIPVVELVRAG